MPKTFRFGDIKLFAYELHTGRRRSGIRRIRKTIDLEKEPDKNYGTIIPGFPETRGVPSERL
jgi:hypothetical protein